MALGIATAGAAAAAAAEEAAAAAAGALEGAAEGAAFSTVVPVAFAAAAAVVDDALFDLAFDATLGDERVRAFLEEANPQAAQRMADDFAMALRRGLWRSRRNSLALHLDQGAGR